MAQAGSPPPPCSAVFSSSAWGGRAAHQGGVSCHQLPLKSSANSVPEPMLAQALACHPPTPEEPQQWVQTGQNHTWHQHLSARASGTFTSRPGDPHGRLSAQHTLHADGGLMHPPHPAEPDAFRSNLPPPQAALLTCPTQRQAWITARQEWSPSVCCCPLPSGESWDRRGQGCLQGEGPPFLPEDLKLVLPSHTLISSKISSSQTKKWNGHLGLSVGHYSPGAFQKLCRQGTIMDTSAGSTGARCTERSRWRSLGAGHSCVRYGDPGSCCSVPHVCLHLFTAACWGRGCLHAPPTPPAQNTSLPHISPSPTEGCTKPPDYSTEKPTSGVVPHCGSSALRCPPQGFTSLPLPPPPRPALCLLPREGAIPQTAPRALHSPGQVRRTKPSRPSSPSSPLTRARTVPAEAKDGSDHAFVHHPTGARSSSSCLSPRGTAAAPQLSIGADSSTDIRLPEQEPLLARQISTFLHA